MSFRYFIYRETDQLEKMPRWYEILIKIQEKLPSQINFYEDRAEGRRLTNNLELDFREDMESELRIDFVDNRPREIYDLLLIYLDDYLTPRLRRLQSVSIFATNLRLAAGGSLFVSTLYALSNWNDPFFFSVWAVSILVGFLVIIFWSFLTMTHYQYNELLLKEYYMKRLEDKRD